MQNQNYLPSKKLTIFIIFAILVLLFVVLKDKIFPETKYTKEQKEFLNTKITDLAITDTDEDGLYDWEEALWATNPDKKDTDGDGIDDKTYVQNRKKELGISDLSKEQDASTTETERISMEFFTIISSLEQKGLLNKDSVQNIGEMFSQQISSPIEINDSSINTDFTTTDNTTASINTYKDTVLGILGEGQTNSVGKELEYFSKYISEPTNKNKEQINLTSLAYKQMADDFLKIKVPSAISETHKNFIINATKVSLAVGLLAEYANDPVLTTKGFILYKEASPLLEENIYSLSAYFKKN